VFFVASARKAQVLRASLIESGQDPLAVAAIVAPAGQAIGAQTPEEIALSVLAAVVAARRGVDAGLPEAHTASAVAAPAAAAALGAGSPTLPSPSKLSAATLDGSPPGAGSCCGGPGA
jgi:xanthine dehydrogenase accessory factor